MKLAICLVMMVTSFTPLASAQEPDGSDINKAIPITFGQTLSDIGDRQLVRNKVYKVVLARGQQFDVVARAISGSGLRWYMGILSPSVLSLGSLQAQDRLLQYDNGSWTNDTSPALTYQVPAAGTYYIWLQFDSTGVNYTFTVAARGTPIAVPNPTTAGCLNGRVDSITYSLQLIAAGLPDEVSIGGTKACPACVVKAPRYPEISDRLEAALRSGTNVEACYDSAGNIFQLKLLRP